MGLLNKKGIAITVDESYYRWLEQERKKFMEKHKLNKLTTKKFTKHLVKRRRR
jgi:hypothetical protein